MKRTSKIWLVIAILFIVVGVLTFVAALALNHWQFTLFRPAGYQTAAADIREPFRDITIRTDTEDIAFLSSDDGRCRVEYSGPEGTELQALVTDGTLSIRVNDPRKWYERIAVFGGAATITVYLPQNNYTSLTIEEETGDVTIPQEFGFQRVKLTASTGDVSCAASASELLWIETSTGDIRLEGLSAGALDLSASTGKVELRSVRSAGSLALHVSTGKAALEDVTCEYLHTVGSTGDITMKDVLVDEMMIVQRSTGDVRLERCDAAELSIQTDTGSVTGSLRSEKVFFATSDTGRVSVPKTTSGGACEITTDTGRIEITIG